MSNTSTTDPDTSKEVAWSFLQRIGLCYTMGGVGGSVYHFFKAFRNPTNGQCFISGIHGVRANAPRAACACALWVGVIHPATVIALDVLREKEDTSLNYIVGGTLTGMLYKVRQGLLPASKFGLCCGAVAATVTGIKPLCIMVDEAGKRMQQVVAVMDQEAAAMQKKLDALEEKK